MNKSVFVLSPYSCCGKKFASRGIMELFSSKGKKLGYFKPVLDSNAKEDTFVKEIIADFGVKMEYQEAFSFTQNEVKEHKAQGDMDSTYDAIIGKFKQIEQKSDFVLVDGNSYAEECGMFSVEFNYSLAHSLNIPTVLVLKDGFTNQRELLNHIVIEVETALEKFVKVVAVFVNKTVNESDKIKAELEAKYPNILFYFAKDTGEKFCHMSVADTAKAFSKYVDGEKLVQKIENFSCDVVTSRMFQYNIVKKAKDLQKHIVMPEGQDDRILSASSQIAQDKIAYITILGDEANIRERVKKMGLYWDDSRIKIVKPNGTDKFEEYAQTLCELRKQKGMTIEQAREAMRDPSYYGTMMVFKGEADGMVSGAVNTTANTIRPSLQFVKTKPGIKTVSSVFFMLLKDRVFVCGDCAVVPNPTPEELKDIAIASADSAKAFGIAQRVAMLSYSSGASGQGPDVDAVKEAVALVKEARPDILLEGPIQYDASVDPKVGGQKLPGSPVAGKATVLVFPDLNTGNNTYKAIQRETGGLAIGPMLQGLRKPVNDLSRGAKVADIYNTIVITAIQAGMEEGK